MPALQVKDFPADLYERLKQCAAEEDRSISQQTTHILRLYLGGRAAEADHEQEPPFSAGKRQLALERMHFLGPCVPPDGMPSVVDMINEMRDERLSQLVEEGAVCP